MNTATRLSGATILSLGLCLGVLGVTRPTRSPTSR